ncbi:EAL domain-containing protein [Sphingomonas sp.]|uniref:EAL domain-containing protein n=1 Tax=Sphingomonas sp. TaxID=28214 RepID=UPI00286E5268|nr:EAL domain-containing protein [Sphingomonas sp.]
MSEPGDAAVLAALGPAIERGGLTMAYQPKASLGDGTLASVEALVRWDDPVLGPVSPTRFVPLAEEHGLIDALTDWGLRATLSQSVAWQKRGLRTRVAFNISAISLQRLDFPDMVEAMCAELGVPNERLVLELTEGATQPLIKLMDTLTRFRIKGFGLAIDDFGTGFSSMMQLRQLPFTEVKIDRSFVADAVTASDSRLIVQSIVGLAHGLGLSSTAEGVETVAQLRLMRELGCDLVQGYLVSPPIAAEGLKAWQVEFAARWPVLTGEESLALWSDVEPNALR